MSALEPLRTERLALRSWRESDRAPFAALNADPRVMRFLGPTLSRAESDAVVDRIEAHFAEHGFGWWAVEAPGSADFIGFVGLSVVRFAPPWAPSAQPSIPRRSRSPAADPRMDQRGRAPVEIGWRLAAEHWGRGYATEGARAALRFGIEQLGLPEIVSFTARDNWASRAVMERIGMRRDLQGDFEHPALAAGNPLRPHVLYRLSRP